MSCREPSRVIHNHYIIFLLIFNFKNKYDEYDRLLKWLLQSLVIDLLKSVNGLSKGYQQHGCLSIDCNSYSYRLYEYLAVYC